MTNSPAIDYTAVLSNLRTRLRVIDKEREELIKAIESMGNLAAIGSIPTIVTGARKPRQRSNGVYETTVALLEFKGSPLRTDEIIKYLKDNEIVPKDRPDGNIATVLYKAARKRAESELEVRRGEWRLKSWN